MKLLGLQQALQHPGCARLAAASRAPRSARRVCVCVKASKQADPEVVDGNVNAYCSLDENGRRPQKELTTQEKEKLFLEAMLAFYYEEKPTLSDAEFDNLKEELTWEGSKVVILSSDEKRFLEARMAYKAGKPIMTDADYEALKVSLAGSNIFIRDDAPKCDIGAEPGKRGQKFGSAEPDYGKLAALNVPPALMVLTALVGVELIPGVDLLKLVQLPQPYGVLVWFGLVAPSVYVVTSVISNLLFKDALILKAPCPNCGTVNTTYFGDILTVAGNRDKNTLTCPCCESKLEFDAQRREVVVTESFTG